MFHFGFKGVSTAGRLTVVDRRVTVLTAGGKDVGSSVGIITLLGLAH